MLKMDELQHSNENSSYEEWMSLLDNFLWKTFGFGTEDGVDFPSRDTYDDGLTVGQAVMVWKKWQLGL